MGEKVRNFEDLAIFQKASDLSKEVYRITRIGDFRYDSRFVQQMRAAVGSIMDNIAEGFERSGNKEFINFLFIAKGSCGEVRSQLIRAHNVGFIDDETFQKDYADCKKLCASIMNFIKDLRLSELKGIKYMQQ